VSTADGIRGRHEHEHGCEDGPDPMALAKRLPVGPRYQRTDRTLTSKHGAHDTEAG
jgi:hypothetical protein